MFVAWSPWLIERGIMVVKSSPAHSVAFTSGGPLVSLFEMIGTDQAHSALALPSSPSAPDREGELSKFHRWLNNGGIAIAHHNDHDGGTYGGDD